MVAATIASDGFEFLLQADPKPGFWRTSTSDADIPDSGVTVYPNNIICGFTNEPIYQYIAAIKVGPLSITTIQRVSSFPLVITPTGAYKNTDFTVRGLLNSNAELGYTNRPSQANLTTEKVSFTTNQLTGYNPTDFWVPSSNITLQMNSVVNEVLQNPNWSTGDYIWFVFTPTYLDDTGFFRFRATESVSGTSVTANYTISGFPEITTTGGDDIVRLGERDVEVIGTNLLGTSRVVIYDADLNRYTQELVSVTDTKVVFNVAGSIVPYLIYKIELLVYNYVITAPVEVYESTSADPSAGTSQMGTNITADDGHEYGASFPGTWESKSSASSGTNFFPDQIIIGEWDGRKFKASIQTNEINLPSGSTFEYFYIKMPIMRCYKQVEMVIKAIADPDVVVGVSNVITGETLTTASVTVDNGGWVGFNPTGYWTPSENPKIANVGAIAAEVMSHANWSANKKITFVIDYNVLSTQGFVGISARDSGVSSATFEWATAVNLVRIDSVSVDDVIDLGEVAIQIVGVGFLGATNLVISKGAISQAQTIDSVTNNRIFFNLTTGTLVADTGYTLSFDVGATTYSTTIDIEGAPATATIQSISGNNIIRHTEEVVVIGVDMDTIDAINITQGAITESYSIKVQNTTRVTFDFTRNSLAMGAATFNAIIGGTTLSSSIQIYPELGYESVTLTDATNKDNSLVYNADPAFAIGDQINIKTQSEEGFIISINGDGSFIAYEAAQTNQNITFYAESYDKSTQTWYDKELITMKPEGFFSLNVLGGSEFSSTGIVIDSQVVEDIDPPVIAPSTELERWVDVSKPDTGEDWS